MTTLYNGEVTVDFQEKSHRYKVLDTTVSDDYIKKTGVTTILGVISKPALMTWPMTEALKELGAKADPITGEWQVPAPLHVTEDQIKSASVAYLRRSGHGKDVGTTVHKRIEQYLRTGHRPLPYEESEDKTFNRQVNKSTGAFVKWFESHDVEVIGVEQVVYSRKYDYCGTFDFILRFGGKTYLGDLKTTNISPRHAPEGIYSENFIQTGGYSLAYLENAKYEGKDLDIDDTLIINASKDGKASVKTGSDVGLSLRKSIELFIDTHSVWSNTMEISNKLKGKE